MNKHVCPWWVGYLLVNPLRKLFHDPERILQPFVHRGMLALDVGCAMGFFTLPMARLAGDDGRVIAVDLQERMIRSINSRAAKAGLLARIEPRVCTSRSLEIDDLAGRVDFALAFAVLHEMPDINGALASICRSLRQGGRLLIAEPTGHVSVQEFDRTIAAATRCGLDVVGSPCIRRCHSRLLSRMQNSAAPA
jgi:ubiquinone/menaquinone biosynthesis C-methylase UbiE